MTHPHVPAAFINNIADEGTKAEAVAYLQKQWNETCALRAALKDLYGWVSDLPVKHPQQAEQRDRAAELLGVKRQPALPSPQQPVSPPIS